MPVYRIAIPLALLFTLSIYFTLEVSSDWALVAVGLAVLLVAAFMVSPLINWWWWQRFPPDLNKGLHGILELKHDFYRALNETDRREFRRRLFLFGQGTNFRPQAMDNVPEDAKLMIAVAAVTMTFNQEDFLFENFENVIVYPHPFPSPQFPESFHASEIYEEDGVIMLSLEHVGRGFLEPEQYFNPAWYEYARVYQRTYPDKPYGDWSSVSWADIEAISGFSHEALKGWIGLEALDLQAFGIAFFFVRPQHFQQQLPTLAQQLNNIFKI